MLEHFNPAIEEIINNQFEEGKCDRQTKINMMIGKLCEMYRIYGKLEELDAQYKNNPEANARTILLMENTENKIEMLGDDISKELYKMKDI